MKKRILLFSKGLSGVMAAVIMMTVSLNLSGQGLQLERAGSEHVYFSYQGKPLLSFGSMSDFIFYAGEDAYDYRKWADWSAEKGMNHCRAYLPGSYVHIEIFASDNGGSADNLLFPFQETFPGSRKFDLTRFDEQYWKRFREQCEYMQSKGIIIDLLMFNGWQLWNYNPRVAALNWDGHFFNPDNNINEFTSHLESSSDRNNRLQFYHSLADNHSQLFEAQKAYFGKIIEMTYDLDNIYYELVHELGMNYSDWAKTSQWIEAIALAVRAKWDKLNPDRPIILGTDAGHLKGFPFSQSGGFPEPGSEIDWVFTRPYFDMLNFGDCHHTANAREWRRKYKKPYVPQESWDDIAQPWTYRRPEMRHHLRKYLWKMMMVKCQQMDFYMKSFKSYYPYPESKPGYTHNYDPEGWSEFENDAMVLREFFNKIIDYAALDFKGHFFISPVGHNLVLSSQKEIIAYISSPSGVDGYEFLWENQNMKFGAQINLAGLPFDDGRYQAEFIDPKSGPVQSRVISINQGKAIFGTPLFVDDYVIHIVSPDSNASLDINN